MSYAGRCRSNDIEKANMLNQYFHSVFSPQKDFCFKDVNPQHSTISNVSICKTKNFKILATLDVTKTKASDGLPPLFFRKTATELCKILNTILKAVKRNRKLPKAWKIGAVSPIHNKGERKLVENYRPVSFLTLKARYLKNASTKNCPRTSPSFLTRNNTGFYHRDQCTRTCCYSWRKYAKRWTKTCRVKLSYSILILRRHSIVYPTTNFWHWRWSPWSLIWLSQRTRTICPIGQYQI